MCRLGASERGEDLSLSRVDDDASIVDRGGSGRVDTRVNFCPSRAEGRPSGRSFRNDGKIDSASQTCNASFRVERLGQPIAFVPTSFF